jgi:hypothetical protein
MLLSSIGLHAILTTASADKTVGQLQFNLSRLLAFERYQQQPALFEIHNGFGQTVALDAFATAQQTNRTLDCC